MQVEEKEEVQSNEKLCTSLFIVGRKCYLCYGAQNETYIED